jgi:hypothetical protein
MKAEMKVHRDRVEANQERIIAKIDAWLEETKACLQKSEPTPEEIETVAEHREVLNEEAAVKNIGATEDRSGDQRLAVRRHGKPKKRAQVNGGPRQKFVARHAVAALRKGHVRRGPGRTLGSGIRDRKTRRRIIDNVVRVTPNGTTFVKRRRTPLECSSGIKGRNARPQLLLRKGRTLDKIFRRTVDLEVAKRIVGSSIRP